MKKFRFNRRRRLYYLAKLGKQSGSPEYIARGVFWGFLIGWAIPFGLQLAVVIPLAFLFHANKVVAGAATFINNHLTVFLMYPFQCWAGSYLIGRPLHYQQTKDIFTRLLQDPSWKALLDLGTAIFIPFFVGGIVLGIITGVIGYWGVRALLRNLRTRKNARVARPAGMTASGLQNR